MADMDDWVRELWLEVRPGAVERIDRIAGALRMAEAGSLRDDDREDALAVAHQLAGSLGSYGFHDAAVAAGEAERLLGEAPVDLDALGDAVARLSAVLDDDR